MARAGQCCSFIALLSFRRVTPKIRVEARPWKLGKVSRQWDLTTFAFQLQVGIKWHLKLTIRGIDSNASIRPASQPLPSTQRDPRVAVEADVGRGSW
jgi:hypothetical protein